MIWKYFSVISFNYKPKKIWELNRLKKIWHRIFVWIFLFVHSLNSNLNGYTFIIQGCNQGICMFTFLYYKLCLGNIYFDDTTPTHCVNPTEK